MALTLFYSKDRLPLSFYESKGRAALLLRGLTGEVTLVFLGRTTWLGIVIDLEGLCLYLELLVYFYALDLRLATSVTGS